MAGAARHDALAPHHEVREVAGEERADELTENVQHDVPLLLLIPLDDADDPQAKGDGRVDDGTADVAEEDAVEEDLYEKQLKLSEEKKKYFGGVQGRQKTKRPNAR